MQDDKITVIVEFPYEEQQTLPAGIRHPYEYGLQCHPEERLWAVTDVLWMDYLLRRYVRHLEEPRRHRDSLMLMSEFVKQPGVWDYLITDRQGNRLDVRLRVGTLVNDYGKVHLFLMELDRVEQ